MIIFDGLYSFLSLILAMLALFINNYIAKKDAEKFPFGKHILEPMVIAIKSIVIGGMCLYSLIESGKAILNGGNSVEYGLGLIYSVTSVIGCGAISWYMKNKEVKLSSDLIKAESTQWLLDTALSGAVLAGFLIAIMLDGTKYSYLNVYIDPMMTLITSCIFIKMPIATLIKSFREIVCVKADDDINEDIYLLVKEIEEEYNFEDSITRVSKIGRELRIEIDFVYNKNSKLKDLDQMDTVREEIFESIEHLNYKKWLNVSFTGNKRWAI